MALRGSAELSKQLQDLRVDVALFSETHLKPHERFFISRFRRKSILAGDLNAKHRYWNSAVSIPSGEKLMALFDLSEFEISAPQCLTNYSVAGNGDVLDTVVHQSTRGSDVIVCDILDSDHRPVIFHILGHAKIRKLSVSIKKSTDCDRFRSLASELISARIEINSGVEADKAARDCTASDASAYRLATSNVTFSDINNDLPDLGRLLKNKRSLRKSWQETRDPACKTRVKWVTKSIRRMTRKKALEQWETKRGNTVKPVINGISRVQNIFPLKPGFRLIKVYCNN
jgi:hypothetical protein